MVTLCAAPCEPLSASSLTLAELYENGYHRYFVSVLLSPFLEATTVGSNIPSFALAAIVRREYAATKHIGLHIQPPRIHERLCV